MDGLEQEGGKGGEDCFVLLLKALVLRHFSSVNLWRKRWQELVPKAVLGTYAHGLHLPRGIIVSCCMKC